MGTTGFAGIVAGNTAGDQDPITVSPNSGANTTGLFAQSGNSKPASIFESTAPADSAIQIRGDSLVGGLASHPGLLSITHGVDDPPGLRIVSTSDASVSAAYIEMNGTASALAIQAGDSDGAANTGAGIVVFGGSESGGLAGGECALFYNQNNFSGAYTCRFENLGGSTNSGHLYIVGEGNQYGIFGNQQTGNAAAIRAKGFDGGANRSSPLLLDPQAFSVAGLGAEEGAFWIETGSFDSGTQYNPRFYGQNINDINWTRGPNCGIDVENYNFVTGGVDDNFFDVIASVEFDNELIPITSGFVVGELTLALQRSINTSNIVAKDGAFVKVTDVTAGATVYENAVDLAPQNNGDNENRVRKYFHASFNYNMPFAGQREFKVEVRRSSPGATGAIVASDIKFRIRPRP